MWQLSTNKLVWRDEVLPVIKSFEKRNISNEEMLNECDEDSDGNIYESNESDNDNGSDYDCNFSY